MPLQQISNTDIQTTTTFVFSNTEFGLGSAALPSISFTGDTNTGIFSPGADTLAFAEGGTEVMRITSGGNVGIGTSSPSTKLEVNGGASSGIFRVSATGHTGLDIQKFVVNSDAIINLQDNGNLRFYTNNTERMRITSLGAILANTTTQTGSTRMVVADATGAGQFRAIHSTGSGLLINQYQAAGNASINLQDNANLAFATNNNDRMTITSAGDVFVGGTSGSVLGYEKFAAYGSGGFKTTGSYALGLWNTANSGLISLYTEAGGTFAGGISATGASLTVFGGSNLNLSSTGANIITLNTNSSERMRITSGGNVGIGTTSPATPLQVNGTITATSVNTNNTFGFKNRIINGAMVIAQRGTSATYSGTGQNVTSYNTIDRFSFSAFGGNFPSGVYATVDQVTDAPTEYSNSLRVTVNQTLTIGSSGPRGIWVRQGIEGFNFRDCWNQQITLSFWVKSSSIGTYSLAFQTEGGGYATSYTINAANTWEYKTITLTHSTVLGTPDSTNGTGLAVVFGLGGDPTWIGTATANQWVAGNIPYLHGCKNLFDTANATWQITGVQLEKGATATSFDYRPYGTELALCQRYFFQVSSTGAANGQNTGMTGLSNGSTSLHRTNMALPVTMRTTPTITLSNVSGVGTDLRVYNGAAVHAVTSLGTQFSNPNYLQADFDLAGSFTTGNYLAVLWRDNVTGGFIRASAEL